MKSENSCGLLLRQINNSLEKRANNDLRARDLTLAQVSALLSIQKTKEKQVTFKELEKILHLAQSTTAGIISRLEQKKLVEIHGDVSDKRIKYVCITPLGEQCCEEAEESMEKTEEILLSPLTDTERSLFYNLLQKVNEVMK